MFYDTIGEGRAELRESRRKAAKQEDLVLMVFQNYWDRGLTPPEVQRIMGTRAPITSIRRAITDLTKKGLLEKTDKMAPGSYGKPNHSWILVRPLTVQGELQFTADSEEKVNDSRRFHPAV